MTTKSKTKFTPGPWTHRSKIKGHVFAGTSERLVANCAGYRNSEDPNWLVENEANAHLCAASPDLYEALLEAIDKLNTAYLEIHGEPYNNSKFNAVIAKARGERRKVNKC